MGIEREVTIGGIRLIQGNSLEIMTEFQPVDHIVCDPPYEQSLHDSKNSQTRRIRTDGRADLSALDFEGIDEIRTEFTDLAASKCLGWFVAFCTVEGTQEWANVINPHSGIRYKRACIWIKPDSTPQLNGQGPAQGAECFVTAWAGSGFSKWNGGGKRGVYTHMTNPRDRHGGHPTEKPWRLMRDILHDFTNPGQTILDPFMGSGTTLVAAALTGRKGIGIEKNPAYFDMAVHRVKKAVASSSALGVQALPQVQEALL